MEVVGEADTVERQSTRAADPTDVVLMDLYAGYVRYRPTQILHEQQTR